MRRGVLPSDVWPNGETREDVLLALALAAARFDSRPLIPPYTCDMTVYRRPVQGADIRVDDHVVGGIHVVTLHDAGGPAAEVEIAAEPESLGRASHASIEDLGASMHPVQGERPYKTEAGVRGWLSDLNGLSEHESVPADTYVRWTMDLLHATLSDWGGPLQMPALTRVRVQCLTAFKMEVGGLAAKVTGRLLARAGGSTLWMIAVDSYPGPWAALDAIAELPTGWVDIIDRPNRR